MWRATGGGREAVNALTTAPPADASAKQLAQHVAMSVTGLPLRANRIAVR